MGEISLERRIVFLENEENSIVVMFIAIVLFSSLLNEGTVGNRPVNSFLELSFDNCSGCCRRLTPVQARNNVSCKWNEL